MNQVGLMQKVLGDNWYKLPNAIRSHYPAVATQVKPSILIGQLDVEFPRLLTLLIQVMHILGGLIEQRGITLPTQVLKWNNEKTGDIHWQRTVCYPDNKSSCFSSRMEYVAPNVVDECIRFGFGIRLNVNEEQEDLVYTSQFWFWKFKRLMVRLPSWLTLGTATIREHALSENTFALDFKIHHPSWGETYSYNGNFQMVENLIDTNESLSEGALFKEALGEDWQQLKPNIRKRFDRNPKEDKPIRYQGHVDLYCSPIGKLIGILLHPLLKAAVLPLNVKNVPVDISVFSKFGQRVIHKSRIYHLPNGHIDIFQSSMTINKHSELVEYIGYGIGIKLSIYPQDGNLYFQSQNYFIDLRIIKIPIPTILSLGKTMLQHVDHDRKSFSICIEIVHPWMGVLFRQSGRFIEID